MRRLLLVAGPVPTITLLYCRLAAIQLPEGLKPQEDDEGTVVEAKPAQPRRREWNELALYR